MSPGPWKAVIYHRSSASDSHADTEATLRELHRTARMLGASTPELILDEHPRPDAARPGAEDVAARVERGEVNLVLVQSLHRLFRNARHLAMTGSRWMSGGVALVSLEDQLDGTTEAGHEACRAALGLFARFETSRKSESVKAGILRSRLAAAGADMSQWKGRQSIVVNRLEIKKLYEDGHRGRYLSLRAIVKRIKATGGRMSNGTLWKVVREMREEGQLDEAKRQALLERTGDNKGGRPKKRLSYDEAEITALMKRGLSAGQIVKTARSLPKRTTRHDVRKILKRLEVVI